MKKCILLSVFLGFLSIIPCTAQFNRKAGEKNQSNRKSIIQLGGGWHFSQTQPKGFNKVLEYYNASSASRLEGIEQMQGASGVLGFYGNVADGTGPSLLFELGYRAYGAKVDASDADPALQFNLHEFSFGMGSTFIQSAHFDWGIGLALNGSLAKTKADNLQGDATNQNFQHFIMGASVFAPIYIGFGKEAPVALSIRPSYQYRFLESDFQDLNRAINPDNYENLPADELKSPIHSLGVEIHLLILLRKVFYY
ncbi:MAG: hypothetical protein NW226_26920 [Microscillaceae bacterium]|nr:hypothetical protein [Microscillaceae bacterium]